MMAKLPFNSFVKIYLYIHPCDDETNALGGTSNLTLQASNALNNELPNVCPTVYIILNFQKMFVTK